jgi:hypothetical protein
MIPASSKRSPLATARVLPSAEHSNRQCLLSVSASGCVPAKCGLTLRCTRSATAGFARLRTRVNSNVRPLRDTRAMVEVVVDASSLARSPSGSITGRIFLRSSAGEFPDARWFDFPVVVLSWWIEGLTRVVSGHSQSFTGLFMDGPFAFTIRLVSGNVAELLWGTRDHPATVQQIEVRSLLVSAAAAGSAVAQVCRANGWSSRDVQALEQALSAAAA